MKKYIDCIIIIMGAATCVFLTLLFFTGCAIAPKIDTPEKKHLVARGELNVLLEEYLLIKEDVPADIHRQAIEAFLAADAVLDAWEARVYADANYDGMVDYAAWVIAKDSLIRIIRLFIE